MEHSGGNEQQPVKRMPGRRPIPPQIWLLVLILLVVMLYVVLPGTTRRSEIKYSFFLKQVQANNVAELQFASEYEIYGKFIDPPPDPEAKKDKQGNARKLLKDFAVVRPPVEDKDLLAMLGEKNIPYSVAPPTDDTGLMVLTFLMYMVLPIGLIIAFWVMIRRSQNQMMGGGGILGNFTKSPARRYEADRQRVTFADVAGCETVKKELEELVEFLKNPQRFQRLGGRIPKGTLLMGPPGTGKTLLAKAIAGEADVPFYSINGSEFIQMFVGVGAGRVRDLFRTAKQNSPCIVFIDEIDAVGRVRGAGFGGGHDEREQTLNQILSEMDGFSPNESVIVIAATNRPDVLDPALLRPGRFDRHITVDRPTLKGRIAIFKVHTRKVPLADNVDLDRLGAGTVGLTGADIRNLVNEAALWATRQGKDQVEMEDFEYSRDKVLMGPRREELLSEEEKEQTAYHEAGHALLAWTLPGVDRVHKVTVVPRGRALGVTQLLPEEDRLNISEHALHARLAFMLGGRAAEKLVYDQYSAGAEDDLKKATALARRMVTHWGMSERLGPVAYRTSEEHPFLGKEYTEQRDFSEHTAQLIDEEVARILHAADDHARRLLEEHRKDLDKFAKALAEEEELDDEQIEALIGPSINKRHSDGNGAPPGVGKTDEAEEPAGSEKSE